MTCSNHESNNPIEDMHAILFERKMISGAALPKKVDGERLSKIYENSI